MNQLTYLSNEGQLESLTSKHQMHWCGIFKLALNILIEVKQTRTNIRTTSVKATSIDHPVM